MPADDEWSSPVENRAVPPALPPVAAMPPVAPVVSTTTKSIDTSSKALPDDVQDRINSVVREAVEQAIAPLKRWQQDVETRLDRVSGSSPSVGSLGRASEISSPVRIAGSPDDPWSPVVASPSRDVGLPSPGQPVRIDMPLELDGGRRHRTAGWIVALLVLVVLTAFASATLVSQATR